MNLNRLYNSFASELANCAKYLTEDSVRYLFYSCMLQQDSNTNHYVMEVPYEMMRYPGKVSVLLSQPNSLITSSSGRWLQELDMLYDDVKNTTICVEVKFHRKGGLPSSFAHTDAAGRMINDMRRLHLIKSASGSSVIKLFVYVTDDEMHNYLSASQNVSSVINPEYRQALSKFYLNGGSFSCSCPPMPNTFFAQANHSFNPHTSFSITANRVFSKSVKSLSCSVLLNGNCHISVFAIM